MLSTFDYQKWGGGIHAVYDKTAGGGDVDKSKAFVPPYVSTSHEPCGVNNNLFYKFPSGGPIACRHLAMQFILDIFSNKNGKVDAAQFSGDEIPKHVDPKTDMIFSSLLTFSSKIFLIQNDNLGKRLGRMFKEMAEKGETVGASFIISPHHAMAIKLHLKEDEESGKKICAVTFYEPNSTGTWVRTTEEILPNSNELLEISRLTTRDFLGDVRDSEYFGTTNTSILIPIEKTLLDQIKDEIFDLSQPKTTKLAECEFDEHTINPGHMYQIMQLDLRESLTDLLPMFRKFSLAKIENLLTAKIDGKYGLIRLIASASGDSPEAYKKLLELLPIKKQVRLLLEVTKDLVADEFGEGSSTLIERYKKILSLLPKEHQIELLKGMAKNAIEETLENNTPVAIETCCKLLELLPAIERASVLEEVSQDSTLKGNVASIKAYKAFLNLIADGDSRFKFLKNISEGGIEKILNLKNGNPEAIAEYGKLLELVSPEQRVALCIPKYDIQMQDLANAFKSSPRENQNAFLGLLLKMGIEEHPGVAKTYSDLLSLVPVKESTVLEFISALSSKLYDNVKIFVDKLFLVPEELAAAVCIPKDSDQRARLVEAFNSSNEKSKLAILELLDKLDLTNQFIEMNTEVTGMIGSEESLI